MTYPGEISYPISRKLGKELGLPAALMLGLDKARAEGRRSPGIYAKPKIK